MWHGSFGPSHSAALSQSEKQSAGVGVQSVPGSVSS